MEEIRMDIWDGVYTGRIYSNCRTDVGMISLWCIAGATDRPFPERAIFGTVRYKSADSVRRRFDLAKYIAKYSGPLVGTLPMED